MYSVAEAPTGSCSSSS